MANQYLDIDWRKPGEALWPEVHPAEKLQKTRATIPTRDWVALYQCRPRAAEGKILKARWFGYWHTKTEKGAPPAVSAYDGDERVYCALKPLPDRRHWQTVTLSVDCTFKKKDDSDFVAAQAWMAAGADDFLLDQICDRLSFTETVDAILRLIKKYPTISSVLVEDKANGSAVLDVLQTKVRGLQAVEPKGGKESRAHSSEPAIRSGNVWLPHPNLAPWVRKFVEECVAFPNGAHDDQVDAMTQYLMTRNQSGLSTLSALAQW